MKPAFYILSSALVIVVAYWAYHVNYTTQEALREVSRLREQIAQERASIAMLNAEWAYLNRPDRLRLLADEYFDELGLMPMTADHFGEPSAVAYPPVDEDRQLAEAILKAVLEASQ